MVLGPEPQQSGVPPLLESPLVAAALMSAFASVAGKSDVSGPGSASAPLPQGRFLDLTKSEWPNLPFSF